MLRGFVSKRVDVAPTGPLDELHRYSDNRRFRWLGQWRAVDVIAGGSSSDFSELWTHHHWLVLHVTLPKVDLFVPRTQSPPPSLQTVPL